MKSKQTITKTAVLAQGLGLAHGKQLELFTLVLWPICIYYLGLYSLQLKCYCTLQVFKSHPLS